MWYSVVIGWYRCWWCFRSVYVCTVTTDLQGWYTDWLRWPGLPLYVTMGNQLSPLKSPAAYFSCHHLRLLLSDQSWRSNASRVTRSTCSSHATTRQNKPMLFYYWASVADGGPILEQHWLNFSCLLCGNHNVLTSKKHQYVMSIYFTSLPPPPPAPTQMYIFKRDTIRINQTLLAHHWRFYYHLQGEILCHVKKKTITKH